MGEAMSDSFQCYTEGVSLHQSGTSYILGQLRIKPDRHDIGTATRLPVIIGSHVSGDTAIGKHLRRSPYPNPSLCSRKLAKIFLTFFIHTNIFEISDSWCLQMTDVSMKKTIPAHCIRNV